MRDETLQVQGPPTPPAEEKIRWELEKLKAETQKLQRPFYKDPPFITAAISALVLLLGVVIQYGKSTRAYELAEIQRARTQVRIDSLEERKDSLDHLLAGEEGNLSLIIDQRRKAAEDLARVQEDLRSAQVAIAANRADRARVALDRAVQALSVSRIQTAASSGRDSVILRRVQDLRSQNAPRGDAASDEFWVYLGQRDRQTGRLSESHFLPARPTVGGTIRAKASVNKRDAMARNEAQVPVYGRIIGTVRAGESLTILAIDSVDVPWASAPWDYRYWAWVRQQR